ncbi:hypothetical protein [Parasediminibacterium sp. JCM 36343]|uniref:hypothetical protein n=1 Tax=Parasediminibacterium sp. JCM 36343 TaxID=3374279 RepID=UPI00397CFB3F
MKYFTSRLLLICTFLTLISKASGQKMDSLSKYSYFLFAPTNEIEINPAGQNQNKSKIATVFFIRKNNKLYLFSAAHSIIGLDYEGKFEKNFPDTFYLRLYKPNSTEMFDLKFNRKQLLGISVDSDYYKTHYDIIYFPMRLPDFEINSIENFITDKELIDDEVPNEAIVYGFAAKNGGDITSSNIDYKTLHPVNLHNKSTTYNSFLIKSGQPTYGFSGSPLLLKTKDSKIIFGGLTVAGTEKVLTFVPQQVIKKILEKL